MIYNIDPLFWRSLALATAAAAASFLWKRIRHHDVFVQMNWMDWCGHFALTGILILFVAGFSGSNLLVGVGMFLMLPLYPIALLGILGKLDDALTDIVRSIRKR